MGKKYIIELEEDAFHQTSKVGSESYLYRAKGFNSLVFDKTGISKLTPYTEPDLDAIRNEAYEKGVQDTIDAPRSRAYKLGYENGLNDSWEATRKIVLSRDDGGIEYEDKKKIFGHTNYNIIKEFTASEAIEKIRQYEDDKQELNIGDVVTFKTAYGVDIGIVVECHVPDVYPDVDKYIV